jgi:RNA polymerase sigma factor (TIGR02999 family)
MSSGDSIKPGEITRLLDAWGGGDRAALDQLLPLVHAELRKLAARRLARERPGHTLQPTALVNEAFLRLFRASPVRWESRAHFFGVAARLMRQVLVDHVRVRQAAKRGGGLARVSLDEAMNVPDATRAVLTVDEALTTLARIDARQASIAELRIFGGLNLEEAGAVLGVSPATVSRDWRVARAWLARELLS